jgi:septum formation protein
MSDEQAAPSSPLAGFVLASASARRQSLLREAGYHFTVHPADLDEKSFEHPNLLPSELARRVAAAKSAAIAQIHPDDVILAADTVVAFGDQTIGKPSDADHARKILRLLESTTHLVITAVQVVHQTRAFSAAATVTSAVRMRPLSPAKIDAYVATGKWEGKAGGYGIQDDDPFVERMTGCLTNIVGLPMTTTIRLLSQAGVQKPG